MQPARPSCPAIIVRLEETRKANAHLPRAHLPDTEHILDLSYYFSGFRSQMALSRTCRSMYVFVWSRVAADAPHLVEGWRNRTSVLTEINWDTLCNYRQTFTRILRRPITPTEIGACFPSITKVYHIYSQTQQDWGEKTNLLAQHATDLDRLGAIQREQNPHTSRALALAAQSDGVFERLGQFRQQVSNLPAEKERLRVRNQLNKIFVIERTFNQLTSNQKQCHLHHVTSRISST